MTTCPTCHGTGTVPDKAKPPRVCPSCGHPWAAHYTEEHEPRPCILEHCGCRRANEEGEVA
jgi:hypothetical protein